MKILVNGKLIVEDDWIDFRVVVVGAAGGVINPSSGGRTKQKSRKFCWLKCPSSN